MRRKAIAVSFLAIAALPGVIQASENLQVEEVSESVYAIVGELGNRSPTNYGNNATFGVIVTSAGIVLIDPGGTYQGARMIHEKIMTISDKPVVLVINTGGQDHRWLGNSYFRARGAEIVANSVAVADQKARSTNQYNLLSILVGKEGLAGTDYVYADRVFDDSLTLTVGETAIVLMHAGAAHTPGDSFVWLPDTRVVFTGDIVYTERMLGVIDVSDSRNWLAVFETVMNYEPEVVVPGHGRPTTMEVARKDTYMYLQYLRQAVKEFMDQGGDVSDISSIDQEKYRYLGNFEELAGRNAQRVYTELEWE